MRIAHFVPVTALAVSMLSAASFAQQNRFQDYDINKDGRISQQEFQNQVRDNHSFDKHDRNQDRRIDENEFGEAGIGKEYGLWDTNDDGYVDENEFYGGTFNQYDAGSDGYWDNNDWEDAVGRGGFDP